MPKHKSEDFKLSAVKYYLTEDVSQKQVCKIFICKKSNSNDLIDSNDLFVKKVIRTI